jgi:hypothetical protein
MSERVVVISRSISTRLLTRAVLRLDGRKHPAKIAAIDEEIRRRDAEKRAA